MKFDHVCFYVSDIEAARNWLVQKLGFRLAARSQDGINQSEVICANSITFVLRSPLSAASPVGQFLKHHPSGVADVAFSVANLDRVLSVALARGADLLHPIQNETQPRGMLRWATISAWGGELRHTLVERQGETALVPERLYGQLSPLAGSNSTNLQTTTFDQIDHAVLNVPAGSLTSAVDWYARVLGFSPQQTFRIQTDYSGLCSQVMVHPLGTAQLPINQPTSQNSQIQEFLDLNRGSGVQHIALETRQILPTIAQLRARQVPLLQVPASYYTELQGLPNLPVSLSQLQEIAAQQVLVDWQEETYPAMLLQTFSQPIFEQPTFFFEFIERQVCTVQGQTRRALGFGEGNFRALFEAIEREQIRRGSLCQ